MDRLQNAGVQAGVDAPGPRLTDDVTDVAGNPAGRQVDVTRCHGSRTLRCAEHAVTLSALTTLPFRVVPDRCPTSDRNSVGGGFSPTMQPERACRCIKMRRRGDRQLGWST